MCYVKSARLLEEGRTHWHSVNKGYIREWIAELLVQQGEFELARCRIAPLCACGMILLLLDQLKRMTSWRPW